jgi:hypothetical protein
MRTFISLALGVSSRVMIFNDVFILHLFYRSLEICHIIIHPNFVLSVQTNSSSYKQLEISSYQLLIRTFQVLTVNVVMIRDLLTPRATHNSSVYYLFWLSQSISGALYFRTMHRSRHRLFLVMIPSNYLDSFRLTADRPRLGD